MTCPTCGGEIPQARFGPPRRYCRQSCQPSRDWTRRQAREGSQALPRSVRACLSCRTEFIGTRGRRFCSQACGSRYHRQADRDLRRAVRKTNQPAELIFRARIFERDEWTCGLCHQSVDPAEPAKSPLSPTLDHILPLSRGGQHVEANVQLAHLICNQRKSARVAA